MAGINKANSQYNNIVRNVENSYSERNKKCIFISHQKDDKVAAYKLAKYIMDADLDVYFDELDNDLRLFREENNPKGVTECILKGINKSDFMICMVSPNSLRSTWVPFEVGYGYDKIELGILALKGIQENDLPQYTHTAKFIVDNIDALNGFIANKTGKIKSIFESENRTFSASAGSAHPLADVMNLK